MIGLVLFLGSEPTYTLIDKTKIFVTPPTHLKSPDSGRFNKSLKIAASAGRLVNFSRNRLKEWLVTQQVRTGSFGDRVANI